MASYWQLYRIGIRPNQSILPESKRERERRIYLLECRIVEGTSRDSRDASRRCDMEGSLLRGVIVGHVGICVSPINSGEVYHCWSGCFNHAHARIKVPVLNGLLARLGSSKGVTAQTVSTKSESQAMRRALRPVCGENLEIWGGGRFNIFYPRRVRFLIVLAGFHILNSTWKYLSRFKTTLNPENRKSVSCSKKICNHFEKDTHAPSLGRPDMLIQKRLNCLTGARWRYEQL